MLDVLLCPEWEYRQFSLNAEWAPGERLTSRSRRLVARAHPEADLEEMRDELEQFGYPV